MDSGSGGFGPALGLYLLAFLMFIWMIIKIARGSGLMALATFFLWPLALISLVRNWGEPRTDIRVPFLVVVLALGMSALLFERGATSFIAEAAPYYSEHELRQIEQEDPASYAVIMKAREDFVASGGDLDALESSDEDWEDWQEQAPPPATGPARLQAESASGDSGALPEPATAPAPLDPLVDLAQTAAGLSYLYGRVEWPQAQAHVQLPSRFRLIPANRLHRLARLRSQPLVPGSLGWITHESVDLDQPEAWVLEVRHIASGHLRTAELGEAFETALGGLSGAPAVDGSGRSLVSGAFAPQWDARRTLLTWALDTPEGESDQFAALPMRQGALLFAVRGLQPDQREFGLRVTRLMAASAGVATDAVWREQPRSGDTAADVSLLQWVQGREPAALPKPLAAP